MYDIIINVHTKGGEPVSPRTGRPHVENPKNERLHIRVTPDEKAKIQEFCKKFNVTMLELIRKGMEAMKK